MHYRDRKMLTFGQKVGRLSLVLVLCGLSPARSAPTIYGGDVPHGSKLVQISVLFRHGDRNPKSIYRKSEFSDIKHWPEGWGELTLTGMKQHERFGQALKAMYGPKGYGLLPLEYNLKDYQVVSTDKDRSIMSAMANNAGLWHPPRGKGINDPDIQWTAVPVNVIADNKYDTIFGQYCPRAHELVTMYRDKRFQTIKDQNYELFAYAEEHSGYEVLTYPTRINWLYDTLGIEKLKKGKIPAWAEKLYPQPLQSFITEYYKEGTTTEELKRLTGGPLLKRVISTMTNITEGKEALKMYAYSAHGKNVYDVLAALGTPPKKQPGYTAAILFELFQHQDSYIVRVLYRPGPDQPAVPVAIPGCQSRQICSLKRFIEVTANVIPKDLIAECEGSSYE
ncbi:lysosomal acid phosphatase-like [Hetaerina americana]|uniref:lysosomal acid phosphatase-like n=1 Tax=Hetaerina americana TaxID=62018 RepID=UPI003A7F1FDF